MISKNIKLHWTTGKHVAVMMNYNTSHKLLMSGSQFAVYSTTLLIHSALYQRYSLAAPVY